MIYYKLRTDFHFLKFLNSNTKHYYPAIFVVQSSGSREAKTSEQMKREIGSQAITEIYLQMEVGECGVFNFCNLLTLETPNNGFLYNESISIFFPCISTNQA